MNRERAKTGSASKNGVHSHVLGKEVYITPIHTRKMRLQPERGEDFPKMLIGVSGNNVQSPLFRCPGSC